MALKFSLSKNFDLNRKISKFFGLTHKLCTLGRLKLGYPGNFEQEIIQQGAFFNPQAPVAQIIADEVVFRHFKVEFF